jgi:hypothetical protein
MTDHEHAADSEEEVEEREEPDEIGQMAMDDYWKRENRDALERIADVLEWWRYREIHRPEWSFDHYQELLARAR